MATEKEGPDAARRKDRRRPRRGLLRQAAVLLLAVVATALLARPRSPEREEGRADRTAAELRPWDLTGCWSLRVEPWEGSGEPDGATDSLPAFLRPPERVMLLPDSVDEWRRNRTTYRAVPLAGPAHEELRGHMRWFVRGDTLWLVWSDRTSRAGVALRPREAFFAGSARAVEDAAGRDVLARAWARPVNCATLAPEESEPGPRR